MSTLYNIIRQLSGRQHQSMKPLKDYDGNTLLKPEDQLKRWKEQFDQVLNAIPVNHPSNIEEGEDLEINTGPVTKLEVMQAVNKLKSGKAPGPDNIPPEVIKASADISADIMLDLIQTAWDTEKVPVEWQTGYIVKLPKKGDLSDPNNRRGIQLLSLPSKVLARIILERIKTEVDKVLREEQAGFRAGRSCADQIATLRIIIEQSIEWNCPLYVNFVDFKKAFDSVDRETIWKILRHYGIPEKIVHIIQSLYDNNLCQVIHDMNLSDPFEVCTGVRQGCLLSPMIFSLVIYWVMKATIDRPRGIQWTLTSQLEDLDYADDIGLLSHSYNNMQQKTQGLQETARSTRLKINTKKTKCLRINQGNNQGISIKGQAIDSVDSFVYLGSIVSKTGGTEEDIKARIGKAHHAFVILKPVWKNPNILEVNEAFQ